MEWILGGLICIFILGLPVFWVIQDLWGDPRKLR